MKTFFENLKRPISNEYDLEIGKPFKLILNAISDTSEEIQADSPKNVNTGEITSSEGTYRIKVKKYMTKPSTPSFDFMDKYNNGVPMPFVEMEGEVIGETRGMFKMNLRGFLNSKATHCMRCGRELTNPVSMLYGLGSECGSHAGINPFDTEEELLAQLELVRGKLSQVTWTGWVIKSAITESEEI